MRLLRDKDGVATGVACMDKTEQEQLTEIAKYLGKSVGQFMVPEDSVVVDRARLERLLAIGRAALVWQNVSAYPGADTPGDDLWQDINALQDGDLDSLP